MIQGALPAAPPGMPPGFPARPPGMPGMVPPGGFGSFSGVHVWYTGDGWNVLKKMEDKLISPRGPP